MNQPRDFVTIVSGLPRSGTSMMMRVMEAGGVPPLVDHLRQPNPDNPGGYYEFERVKMLKEDSSWVGDAKGMAVKVIYKLVADLPTSESYRIVFMQRDLEEVLRSQETMMRRDGLDPDTIGRDTLLQLFQTEVFTFRRWAEVQKNIRIFYADYRQIIDDPEAAMGEIAAFLESDLDIKAMAEVVNPDLYRNRAS